MTNRLSLLSMLILLLLGSNISCRVQSDYLDPADIEATRPIVDKALEFIKNAQFDSLQALMDPQLLSQYKADKLDTIMEQAKVILDSSVYPKDSEIITYKYVPENESGKREGITFSLPFEQVEPEKSTNLFQITVINKKIYGFNLIIFPKEWPIDDLPAAEPHKTSFNLDSQKLSWFRIWYEGGIWDKKKYGEDEGFYAVSGGAKELEEIGIKPKFQEVFELINEAEFDSLDVQHIQDTQIGDPEWIYLRMKFEGAYKELKEVQISYFIKEEEGQEQISSGYIVLQHNSDTRYLLRADNNPELSRHLIEIGRYDYTGFFETD